jgi:hypothetical protein
VIEKDNRSVDDISTMGSERRIGSRINQTGMVRAYVHEQGGRRLGGRPAKKLKKPRDVFFEMCFYNFEIVAKSLEGLDFWSIMFAVLRLRGVRSISTT